MLLCDKYDSPAAMHCASWKCSRVTRSALAGEIYAFAAAFDFALALQHDIKSIADHCAPIAMLADSMRLFDAIAKLTELSEKRLLTDASALRESYSSAEISNAARASSQSNLAGCLAKKVRSRKLSSW